MANDKENLLEKEILVEEYILGKEYYNKIQAMAKDNGKNIEK